MHLVQKVKVARAWNMSIYPRQTASQSSLFVGFLISWISLHTKTTKIDFPVLKWLFHPTNTSLLSYYRQCLVTTQMYKKWSKMKKTNAKPSEHFQNPYVVPMPLVITKQWPKYNSRYQLSSSVRKWQNTLWKAVDIIRRTFWKKRWAPEFTPGF